MQSINIITTALLGTAKESNRIFFLIGGANVKSAAKQKPNTSHKTDPFIKFLIKQTKVLFKYFFEHINLPNP
jgi:hypothetical protein